MDKLFLASLYITGLYALLETIIVLILNFSNIPILDNIASTITSLVLFSGILAFSLNFFKITIYKKAVYLNFVYFFLSYFFKKLFIHDHLLRVSFIEYLEHQGSLAFIVQNSIFYLGAVVILNLFHLGLIYRVLRKSSPLDEKSLWHSFSSFIGHIVLASFVLLPLYTYLNFTLFLSNATHGMIQFSGLNLFSESRTYQKQDKTYVLIPMVHLANKDFYSSILKPFEQIESVILQEGVKDKNKLIRHDGSYKGLAKVLGLSTQKEHFKVPKEAKSKIVSADIDVSIFSKTSIEMINSIFKITSNLNESKNLSQDFLKLQMSLANKETMIKFFYEILELRNIALIKKLEEIPTHLVIIPWGALHLPQIEAHLIEQGFKLKTKERFLVINFLNRDS